MDKTGAGRERRSGSWSYWRARKGETRVMVAGFRLNSIYALTGDALSAAFPGFGAPGAGLLSISMDLPGSFIVSRVVVALICARDSPGHLSRLVFGCR